MQFSQATVVAFLAATTVAGHVPPEKDHHTGASNTTWVTTTVSNYVTYCPESTTFEVGNHTYTATGSQWVTVTECPQQCTISWQPSATASPTVCPGTIIPKGNGTHVASTGGPAPAPAPTSNSTYNIPTPGSNSGSRSGNTGSGSGNTGSGSNSGSTGSGSGSENTPNEFTGAATKLAGSSAALAAVFGAVVYYL